MRTAMLLSTKNPSRRHVPLMIVALLFGISVPALTETISVKTLLQEMVDFENLARRPTPLYKEAMSSSYSEQGGDAWFDNADVGQYLRTEINQGRREYVLADLKGPGAVTRFWSANPNTVNLTRFYFDGEIRPRLAVPLAGLFTGTTVPFGTDFSYISGTGGNLYYPIPYATSLKITVEETKAREGEKLKALRLYYQIGYRTYPAGTPVKTFDLRQKASWQGIQTRVAQALSRPSATPAPEGSRWISRTVTIASGTACSS